MITAGLVDRAIDEWEKEFGRSTVKNTVSALVLVLDEAVRDGTLRRTELAARPSVALSATKNFPAPGTSHCPTWPPSTGSS